MWSKFSGLSAVLVTICFFFFGILFPVFQQGFMISNKYVSQIPDLPSVWRLGSNTQLIVNKKKIKNCSILYPRFDSKLDFWGREEGGEAFLKLFLSKNVFPLLQAQFERISPAYFHRKIWKICILSKTHYNRGQKSQKSAL